MPRPMPDFFFMRGEGRVRVGGAGADDAEARPVFGTDTGLLVVRAPTTAGSSWRTAT